MLNTDNNQILSIAGNLASKNIPSLSSIGGIVHGNNTITGTNVFNNIKNISGIGSFSRNLFPWKRLAEWTHKIPKTATDLWLDDFKSIIAKHPIDASYHRMFKHNPIDFLNEYLFGNSPYLSIKDYVKHVGCDIITTRGIPLMPEKVHCWLLELGIPEKILLEWTHKNIFDIAIGGLSLYDGGHNFFLAITGQLPWKGVETIIFTFGKGIIDVGGGIYTSNPFLLAGGALNIGAGAVSYFKHIHLPSITVLDPSILAKGFLNGAFSGSMITFIQLGMSWNETTPSEKILSSAESISLSSTLGMLSKISPWISVPLGLTYSFGKFSWEIANNDFDYWQNMQTSTNTTALLSLKTIYDIGGEEALLDFKNFILNKKDDYKMSNEIKRFLELDNDNFPKLIES